MKLSRCVIIYCTHLLGLQAIPRRWVRGRTGRQKLPPWIPIMPIPQWFMESLPKAGDKWPSHIVIGGRYQQTGISVSQPPSPPGHPSGLCVFVCVQVCMCVRMSRTDIELVLGGKRALLVAFPPRVWVCLCGSARPSVYVVAVVDKSLCTTSRTWKSDWFHKLDLMSLGIEK